MTKMLSEITQIEDTELSEKYLTFAVDDGVFAINISFVTEIVGMQKINEIPEAPEYIKGIINLRDKIISIIDIRLKLKKAVCQYTERTCIVIVEIQDITIGLIVDSVNDVVTITDSQIVPPPSFKTGFQNNYLMGIAKAADKKLFLMLDCEKLLLDKEIKEISNIII